MDLSYHIANTVVKRTSRRYACLRSWFLCKTNKLKPIKFLNTHRFLAVPVKLLVWVILTCNTGSNFSESINDLSVNSYVVSRHRQIFTFVPIETNTNNCIPMLEISALALLKLYYYHQRLN